MIFEQIRSGGDRNFAYIIVSEDTEEAALVDPSPEPQKVMARIGQGVKIKYVINTHSHFDHASGNDRIARYYKGPITFVNTGNSAEPRDGDVLELGELKLRIFRTPGHTEDSICIKVRDKLMTGDTLFVGKVGGTFGESDAAAELESLKKIMKLAPNTGVWPGHDYGIRPHSSIAYEFDNNPFIERLDSFKDFLWLKQNWARYKKEHGIR